MPDLNYNLNLNFEKEKNTSSYTILNNETKEDINVWRLFTKNLTPDVFPKELLDTKGKPGNVWVQKDSINLFRYTDEKFEVYVILPESISSTIQDITKTDDQLKFWSSTGQEIKVLEYSWFETFPDQIEDEKIEMLKVSQEKRTIANHQKFLDNFRITNSNDIKKFLKNSQKFDKFIESVYEEIKNNKKNNNLSDIDKELGKKILKTNKEIQEIRDLFFEITKLKMAETNKFIDTFNDLSKNDQNKFSRDIKACWDNIKIVRMNQCSYKDLQSFSYKDFQPSYKNINKLSMGLLSPNTYLHDDFYLANEAKFLWNIDVQKQEEPHEEFNFFYNTYKPWFVKVKDFLKILEEIKLAEIQEEINKIREFLDGGTNDITLTQKLKKNEGLVTEKKFKKAMTILDNITIPLLGLEINLKSKNPFDLKNISAIKLCILDMQNAIKVAERNSILKNLIETKVQILYNALAGIEQLIS